MRDSREHDATPCYLQEGLQIVAGQGASTQPQRGGLTTDVAPCLRTPFHRSGRYRRCQFVWISGRFHRPLRDGKFAVDSTTSARRDTLVVSVCRPDVERIDAVPARLRHRRRSWSIAVSRFTPELDQSTLELAHCRGMRATPREIPRLVRIVLKIVELPFLRLLPEVNQLPSPGSYASIFAHTVLGRILVILVQKIIAPWNRSAGQYRREASAVHPRRNRNAGKIEERRCDIDVEGHVRRVYLTRRYPCRVFHQHRNSDRGLVHQPLVEQAVLAQEKTVIRRIHDDRVPRDSIRLELP